MRPIPPAINTNGAKAMSDIHEDRRGYMLRRAIEEKAEDKEYHRMANFSDDFPEDPPSRSSKLSSPKREKT